MFYNRRIGTVDIGRKCKDDLYSEWTNYQRANESIVYGVNHPCASFFTDFIPYCIACGISSCILERIVSKNPAEFYDF